MGNNQAFAIFEYTVMGAYNLGVLTKPLLKVLLEPYSDTDIDPGGRIGLKGKDGLEVEEVVLKVWGIKTGKKPEMPGPKLPKAHMRDWPPEWQEWIKKRDRYDERVSERFDELTRIIGWS